MIGDTFLTLADTVILLISCYPGCCCKLIYVPITESMFYSDIDECTVNSPDCGVGGTCVDTEGSYECQCVSTSTSSGGTDPCVGMY